MHTHNVYAHN